MKQMSIPEIQPGALSVEFLQDEIKVREAEIARLRELCNTLITQREEVAKDRDRFYYYLSEIGDYVLGKRDRHTPDAVKRETIALIEDLRDARKWPDIGPDPLRCRKQVLTDEDASRRRLSSIVDLQQPYVPDQTALVWRIDINRVCGELIWRRAGFISMKKWIDNLVPAIKELSPSGYSDSQIILRAFIETYGKKIPEQGGGENKPI